MFLIAEAWLFNAQFRSEHSYYNGSILISQVIYNSIIVLIIFFSLHIKLIMKLVKKYCAGRLYYCSMTDGYESADFKV